MKMMIYALAIGAEVQQHDIVLMPLQAAGLARLTQRCPPLTAPPATLAARSSCRCFCTWGGSSCNIFLPGCVTLCCSFLAMTDSFLQRGSGS